MWWGAYSNTDTNCDTDCDAHADANTDADANSDTNSDTNAASCRSEQFDGYGSFDESDQPGVDGQLE